MTDPRSYDDLNSEAVNFWPAELVERERDLSIIPRLISTQDKFISLLHVADTSPDGWKTILPRTSQLPANLFLKHLIILSDIGGEKLQRFKNQLPLIFEDNTMRYTWKSENYAYTFKTFDLKISWNNRKLSVDGDGLSNAVPLDDLMEDVIMLLMHGAASTNEGLPEVIVEKCVIGNLLGNKRELDKFVRQRYIWVSRITGGASANAMGYLAQNYIKEQLQNMLPNWDFSMKTISGISQTGGRTDLPFDMVAESPQGRHCGIEVSFQFTTNSTIERKAGQAQARQSLLHEHGHHIAYVIDGAGNFERRSALSTICLFSDCTVTFKESEIRKLADFLQQIEPEASGNS